MAIRQIDTSKFWKNNTAINGFHGLRNNVQNMARSTGVIIPLYIYPADVYNNTSYNSVIDLAKEYRHVPTAVVLNPSSGPGTVVDGNYAAAVRRMAGADILVLGYVSTAYMATSIATVKSHVDKWVELYPEIRGIWVDELKNFADSEDTPFSLQDIIDYYSELNRYIKESANLDFNFVNPGTTYAYQIWQANCGDVFAIYESASMPTETVMKQDGAFEGALIEQPTHTKAALVHTIASWDAPNFALLKKYYGWVFVTDDSGANPYDALTDYLTEMYQGLE